MLTRTGSSSFQQLGTDDCLGWKKREDLRKLHLLGARGELHNSPKGDSDRPNFEQKKRCNSQGSILCAQLKRYTVSTLKTDAASNFVKLAFFIFSPPLSRFTGSVPYQEEL